MSFCHHRIKIKAVPVPSAANLFTSLRLSMVIRRTVILQFKCIKFQMAQSQTTPFHLLQPTPPPTWRAQPKIDKRLIRFSFLSLVQVSFSDKMPNMECNLFLPRNMIRKSYLIQEFITYCQHSTEAFIDPFIDSSFLVFFW